MKKETKNNLIFVASVIVLAVVMFSDYFILKIFLGIPSFIFARKCLKKDRAWKKEEKKLKK